MPLRRYRYLVFVPLLPFILTTFMMVSLTTPSTANTAGGSCTVNPSSSSDHSTIQDAVDDLDCTTIDIAPGLYTENIIISRTVNLAGAGASQTVIDGSNSNRVLFIGNNATVNLTDVTIRNGAVIGQGGTSDMGGGAGIRNEGTLTLSDSIVRDNLAMPFEFAEGGGAIFNSGSLTLVNVTIQGNTASEYVYEGGGGAIDNSGELTIYNSLFQNNRSTYEASSTRGGGAIFNRTQGVTNIFNTEFISNAAVSSGGAVSNLGLLSLSSSSFISNTTGQLAVGGGIYNDGIVEMTGTLISGNASREGAGIFNGASMKIANGIITNNIAGTSSPGGNGAGGGIYNTGILDINTTDISNNWSTGDGAAINTYRTDSTAVVVTVTHSTLYNNHATGSGGAVHNISSDMTLSYSSVNDNTASGDGGGVHNSSGTLTITHSTISNNVATWSGGGISVLPGARVLLDHSLLDHNTAGAGGGGASIANSAVAITNSTITSNQAGWRDGGGLRVYQSQLAITSSTIVNNSADQIGGIFNEIATISLKNTIIAQNNNANCGGFTTVTSEGYNLEDADECGFSATGDITDILPIIGPLANNGGPTFTHALLKGSPAIDAGSEDCPPPSADQRNVPRPQDGDEDGVIACDIGAFEVSEFVVPTATNTPTRTPTLTPTNSPTFTPTATNTPSPTATVTGSATPTLTATRTPTHTPTSTPTRTATTTRIATLTATTTSTPTPSPTKSIGALDKLLFLPLIFQD